VQHGHGLVTQRAALQAICRREGWQLVDVYEDPGVAGTPPWFERAGLTAALDAMRTTLPPLTGLLVARWDRRRVRLPRRRDHARRRHDG
jgi:hypothetical protein